MHVQNHLKGENFEVQHQLEYERVKAKIKFCSRNEEMKKSDGLEASNDIW